MFQAYPVDPNVYMFQQHQYTYHEHKDDRRAGIFYDGLRAIDSERAAKEAFSGNTLGSSLPSIKIKKKEFEKKFNIIDLVVLCDHVILLET